MQSFLNSLFLLTAALVFNNVLRRRYPHPVVVQKNIHDTADQRPIERLGFIRADLDAALKEHKEMLDISEDDLEEIFMKAEANAFQRHTGGIRCRHIMSRDVVVVHRAMPVPSAQALLINHKIHALPVVDDGSTLVGIVTLHDMFKDWENLSASRPSVQRVEEVMTHKVQTIDADQPVSDLISSLLTEGFTHVPVVDSQRRVIGMVTQSDIVAALYRAGIEDVSSVRVPALY